MEEQLKALIKEINDLDELRALLSSYQPYDIAQVFTDLDDENQRKILEVYTNEELAEIFSYIDSSDSSDILEDMDTKKAAAILTEMETDDAYDVLDEMKDKKALDVVDLLDEDIKEDLKTISKYDDDTAGAIMNPNFLKVLSGKSVKEAMNEVIKNGPEAETIDTIFIVDENNKLLGVMDLKKLICARMPKKVNDVMMENYAYVNADDPLDITLKKVKDYDILSLPVLKDGVIEGIITMDDAFEALTKKSEDDYAKLAGLTDDEDKQETVWGSFKKRIPWLAILLVLDVLIALVIARFDEVIEKITVLTFFQAAVLGLAGNCGTQSLAVTVRKIADGEVNKKGMILKFIGKEVLQGLITGLILGVLSFGFVIALLYIKHDTQIDPVKIGLVLGIAVTIAVTLANLSGSLMPVIFYKIGVDPAVASGPFITTLNDIVAVVTYFGIAMIILSNYL